jgi:hypothetical protein
MLTKVCRQCERELPLVKFDKQSHVNGNRGSDGRRGTCRQCRGAKQPRARAPDAPAEARFTRPLNATRYLITSAQNATPVHAEFFAALKVAAAHLRAELVVIPFRYKNPTSQWTQAQAAHEHWAPELAPYLHNTRKKLNANLVLAADVKIQPTASAPLNGFEALTGSESCIFGHPKMQYRAIPSPLGRLPKILSTTGAVTLRNNYTDTKAGKLGEFHHFLGAIVVEIDGPTFHLRQINADRRTGEFIDLDRLYTPKGVSKAPPAAGLVMGDVHARFTSPEVERATFGPGGIVEVLQPRKLVWHDLLDGYAVNPHHLGNPFIAHAKAQAGFGDPEAEVKHAVQFVADRTPKSAESVIVASNHDDFLARWINTADWRQVGAKVFYLKTALAMLERTEMTAQGTEYEDPFRYWVGRHKGGAKIRALRRNESLKIAGVECSLHGHRGPNGAKATMKNLARIGARVISAHAHTPGIEEGHYRVGTSTPLALEYTSGPSSWLNAHAVIYANGRRSLIVIVEGAWRASQQLRRAA